VRREFEPRLIEGTEHTGRSQRMLRLLSVISLNQVVDLEAETRRKTPGLAFPFVIP